jgi:hypothetical protein
MFKQTGCDWFQITSSSSRSFTLTMLDRLTLWKWKKKLLAYISFLFYSLTSLIFCSSLHGCLVQCAYSTASTFITPTSPWDLSNTFENATHGCWSILMLITMLHNFLHNKTRTVWCEHFKIFHYQIQNNCRTILHKTLHDTVWYSHRVCLALIMINVSDGILSTGTWFIPALTKATDGSQKGITGLDLTNVWSCSCTK